MEQHDKNLFIILPVNKYYSKNISDVKKGKAKKVQVTEQLKGVKSL